MWILHLLPDSFMQFVVHAIVLVGAICCFFSFFIINRVLRFFPQLASYYKIMQLLSVVLLAAGIYFEGGIATEMQWRGRVAEVEAKLKVAEALSAAENVKIVTKVVKKLELVRTRGNDIIEYVDREVIKYDKTCPVPAAVVQVHNEAARDLRLKFETTLTMPKDKK